MDRLPFASEGCCRKSLICIRPHMRASPSSYFFIVGSFKRQRGGALFGFTPRRSSRYGRAFPCKPHIRRKMFPPRSRIRDGRAPGGRHHSVRRHFRLPGRTTTTPPGIRMHDAALQSGLNSQADQWVGFMTAPSGTTPWVANCHNAIRSRRAIATTITLRIRRPVPLTRSRNQPTRAELGW